MEKGLVSIVIPCYNMGRYLPQAIDSALAQTYRPLEIIVVDDGSIDDSCKKANRYSGKIKYIRQKNQGPASARNMGVLHSKGEFIQFLDADDIILPDKIESQVKYLSFHPETNIVFSDVRAFQGNNTNNVYPENWRKHMPRKDFVEAFAYIDIMAIHSPLIRRSVFDRLGGFPTKYKMAGEDWFFWMKASLEGERFDFLPTVKALYRMHKSSLTGDVANKVGGETEVLDDFVKLFQSYKVTEEGRWFSLAFGFFRVACNACDMKDIKLAKILFQKGAKILPPLSSANALSKISMPLGEESISDLYSSFMLTFYENGLREEAEMMLESLKNVIPLFSWELATKEQKWVKPSLNMCIMQGAIPKNYFHVLTPPFHTVVATINNSTFLYPLTKSFRRLKMWRELLLLDEKLVQLNPTAVRPRLELFWLYIKHCRPKKALFTLWQLLAVIIKRFSYKLPVSPFWH